MSPQTTQPRLLGVLAFGLALGLALPAGGCDCNQPTGSECPEVYQIGEKCFAAGLVCPYPGAKCGTSCTCKNQLGGFAWDCHASTCACTCPCGQIAINSCEALECAKQQDPCPASAAAICGVVCSDGSVPDARPREAGGDARRDAAPDQRRDLPPRDRAPDAPPDAKGDLPLDAKPDLPLDAAPDAPLDSGRSPPLDLPFLDLPTG